MEVLKKEDVLRVIEGKGAAKRIPLLYDIWIYDNVFQNDAAKRNAWLEQYPCDVDEVFLQMPGMTEGPKEDPDFYWAAPGKHSLEGRGLDAQCLIEDWEDAGEFYDTFPDPKSPALIWEKKKRMGVTCWEDGGIVFLSGFGPCGEWKMRLLIFICIRKKFTVYLPD